jgi:hypothetical protein
MATKIVKPHPALMVVVQEFRRVGTTPRVQMLCRLSSPQAHLRRGLTAAYVGEHAGMEAQKGGVMDRLSQVRHFSQC